MNNEMTERLLIFHYRNVIFFTIGTQLKKAFFSQADDFCVMSVPEDGRHKL